MKVVMIDDDRELSFRSSKRKTGSGGNWGGLVFSLDIFRRLERERYVKRLRSPTGPFITYKGCQKMIKP